MRNARRCRIYRIWKNGPLGSLLALVLRLFFIADQSSQAFTGDEIDWNSALGSYIGLPPFLILWMIYKVKHKTMLLPLKDSYF
ncbi:amino acid permease [Sporosarcina luteola]|nr:amino acid permease [Sporosarcina luteola]